MSCSKDSAVDYLKKKALIKDNMELYTKLPTARLIDTIDKLTDLAKSKYGVDMGPLFRIRTRDVSIGNYATMGNSSIVSKIRLEPNEEAFSAIDGSKMQENMKMERQFQQESRNREIAKIEEEGNYMVSEEGDVLPSVLPKINIKC